MRTNLFSSTFVALTLGACDPADVPVAFDAKGEVVELHTHFDTHPEAVEVILPADEEGKVDCGALMAWSPSNLTIFPDFCRVPEDSSQCERSGHPGPGYLSPGAGTLAAAPTSISDRSAAGHPFQKKDHQFLTIVIFLTSSGFP